MAKPKHKSMTLVFPSANNDEWGYRISRVGNSIAYSPGEWLSAEEVEKLCDDPGWTIVVVRIT